MKKKILIPTDFSKNAWNALLYAVDLYKDLRCEFYLLNTFNANGYILSGIQNLNVSDEHYKKAKMESEKGLEKVLKQISMRNESSNHQFIAISRYDDLIAGIKEVLDMKDIELVVMGTRGKSNLMKKVFGTNTVKAMEEVRNCPVLAVPDKAVFSQLKEIVFPTSFKTHYKNRELLYLNEIAKISNCPIQIVHHEKQEKLDETQRNYKALLEDCLEGLDYHFHWLNSVDFRTALECFIQNRDSGMVVFINKKHTLFNTLFSRPLVKNLGYHSEVPILALHDLRN